MLINRNYHWIWCKT